MFNKLVLSLLLASTMLSIPKCSTSFVPLPQKIEYGEDLFTIKTGFSIVYRDAENKFNADYLRGYLKPLFLFDIPVIKTLPSSNFIVLEKVAGLGEEEYFLEITKNSITIQASTKAGSFYGIQTLMQMFPAGIYAGEKLGLRELPLPCIKIKDAPRFAYRGSMLDVSRTFFDADYVKRYIDWLSYHKINKFHWHLTDDNGWRIEIKKYPFLTSKGAWRGENEVLSAVYLSGKEKYGGFYTQEEIKSIVAYAAERNIEIIPEIDLPGHSRAVVASYPETACNTGTSAVSACGERNNVWCAGKESNFKMLENIIKEVSKLFPSEYIHIGGDEVNLEYWNDCPECQKLMKKEGMEKTHDLLPYFINRMEAIIAKYGKKSAGWDEILENSTLTPDSRIYAWRSKKNAKLSLAKGQPTVIQVGAYYYLDMKQSEQERGHDWAGIIPLKKIYEFDPVDSLDLGAGEEKFILGPQTGLWTELMQTPPRFAEYQTFPRLCALAETGWTGKELKNFEDFSMRLNVGHFDRLYKMGIAFRVEPPKVKYSYENYTLTIEPPYENSVVRYTLDGSDPTSMSPIYREQIVTNTPRDFKFATFYSNDLRSISVKASNVSMEYLTPNTTIETNIPLNEKTPLEKIASYNFKSFVRSKERIQAGDYLLYTFEEPVACSKITINTGYTNIPFYGVTEGYVEYSYDGINFIKGDEFYEYSTIISDFEKPIKSVRIVVTGKNDGFTACFQSLKIEK